MLTDAIKCDRYFKENHCIMKKKMCTQYSTVLRTMRGTMTVKKFQLMDLKKTFFVHHPKILEHIIKCYNTKSTLLQRA